MCHRRTKTLLLVAGFLCAVHSYAQHGVTREYAAFAPKSDAMPLAPLLDVPLTDVSIAHGPDGAFYMTGSAVKTGAPVFTSSIEIWRSMDMKKWARARRLDFGETRYGAPEIHFIDNAVWLTLGKEGGGTELLKFDGTDIAADKFRKVTITSSGRDPSIFRDEDGTFFWVTGGGEIARMRPNPMEGLASSPARIPVVIAGAPPQARGIYGTNLHGAFLTRIDDKYHLFVTGTLMKGGLGRTGLPQGVNDVLVAASEKPDRGYSRFYVAFPNAGQTTLFTDAEGKIWGTFSGNDDRAIFRGKPGAFKVEKVPAKEPLLSIGFAKQEAPTRFPFGLMLRPGTAFVYERGMGSPRLVTLDKVPDQKMPEPWIRDTFILVGQDGSYYLTGTSGNMDGVNLWRSPDLKHFQFVKQVWTAGTDTNKWYNPYRGRFVWAPEMHYARSNYWLTFCINNGPAGKNGLLRSTTGKPEGPYELAFPGNRGVDQNIDSSLFEDSDGSVYYVWQDGLIRKLNSDMNGFDGEQRKIVPVDGQRVGYEGATLVKMGGWYVLTAAEWNGGSNYSDGTYDMMYSCAKILTGPWKPRRVAVPHAGHGALFKDKKGRWNASFFGNDRTAPFRAMPGYVPVEIKDTGSDLIIVASD